ncbi:MAG: radical SAM protein [Deltaproteobacteria bacterium]|nr:radical SAM protein [Deltaproteobacteria bacterium]
MSPLTELRGRLPRRVRRLRRYAGLLKPVLRSNLGRLDAPWKLTLATTYVCNHKCNHCGIWTRRPKGEMETADFEALFAANPSVRWLDLTGGEPTARSDLPAIVQAAGRHLPDLLVLHFPTNGTLPAKAVHAARAAVDATAAAVIVTVSLDGPRAVHDAIRGVDGAWRSALETFAALRDLPGVEVVLGMTLTPDNAGTIEQTYDEARDHLGGLDRDCFHFNVAQRSAHFYGNESMEMADHGSVLDALRRADASFPSSPRALMERAYRGLVPRFLRDGRSPVTCQSLSASCFVDPWGTVYPCITEDRPLAKLQDHDWSLASVWRATHEAAADMAAGRCDGCWTPCEAYQSLLGALPAAGSAAVRGMS